MLKSLNLALTKTDPLLKRINSTPVLKSMAIIGTVGVIFRTLLPTVYIRTVGCKSCKINKPGGWNKRGGWDFLEKTST